VLKLYVRIPEKISVSHLAKLSLLYAGNKNTENKIIKKEINVERGTRRICRNKLCSPGKGIRIELCSRYFKSAFLG